MMKKFPAFANIDAETHRKNSSEGGSNVPREKRFFFQNPDAAAKAGRKGGANMRGVDRSFSKRPDWASECGRRGAAALAEKRRKVAAKETPSK